MWQVLTRFVMDDNGATAIEYGLIAALISVSSMIALESMGAWLRTAFDDVRGYMESAASP